MDGESVAHRVKRRRGSLEADSKAFLLLDAKAKQRMEAYHTSHHEAAARARSEKRPFVSATCAMRRGETHVQHYERFLANRSGRSEEKRDWENFVREARTTGGR